MFCQKYGSCMKLSIPNNVSGWYNINQLLTILNIDVDNVDH